MPVNTYPSLLSIYDIQLKLLGKGSFGQVYQGRHKSAACDVAVKHARVDLSDLDEVKLFVREMIALRVFHGHPYLLSLDYFAMEEQTQHLYFVFKCLNTDLHRIIKSSQCLSTEHVAYILYQILHGVSFIHSAGWVHRDLKPSNIFINGDCSIKIGDFGLARAVQDSRAMDRSTNSSTSSRDFRQRSPYRVTRWYRSPEILLSDSTRGEAPSDMWSVGCILGELLSREALFRGKNSIDTFNLIINVVGSPNLHDLEWFEQDHRWDGYHTLQKNLDHLKALPFKPRQNFQENFSDAHPYFVDLLEKLLEFHLPKRFTAEQALQHPAIQSLQHESIQPLLQVAPLVFSYGSMPSVTQTFVDEYLRFEAELDRCSLEQSSECLLEQGKNILRQAATSYVAPHPKKRLASKALSRTFIDTNPSTIAPQLATPSMNQPSIAKSICSFFYHQNVAVSAVEQREETKQAEKTDQNADLSVPLLMSTSPMPTSPMNR